MIDQPFFDFSDNIIVDGNMTVRGTTTTVDSTAITLADNIITLASNAANPSDIVEAGIEVNRGSGQSKPTITYFESDQRWKWSTDGTTYYVIPTEGEFNTNTQRSDEDIRDVVAAQLVGGTNVTITENDAANTITISSANTQRTDEEIMDKVADVLVHNASHTGITATDDDAGNGVDLATTFHTADFTVTGTANPVAFDLLANGFRAPVSVDIYEISGQNMTKVLTDVSQNTDTQTLTMTLAADIQYQVILSGRRA